jgi:hypothetical protein
MRPLRPYGYEVFALLSAIGLLLFPTVLLSQVSFPTYVSRSAGTGASSFDGDQGLATAINLNSPSFVLSDATGSQYLSDTGNNCVRRIDPAGNITTVAGLATTGTDTCDTSSNVNPAPAEGLARPTGLALDATGRLYIADSLHHCIRSLAPGKAGVASLITAVGTCGSSPAASITPNPQGLALDSSGNLYIAVQIPAPDPGSAPTYQVLRHTASSGPADACWIVGAPSSNLAACPNITGTAILDHPSGLAFDNVSNTLYIADTGNQCVRRLTGLTTLETAAGQCANDGTGTSLTAVHNPFGVAITSTGALLITQSSPDNVVSLAPNASSLTLIAGQPGGAAGPYSLSQDGVAATTVPLNAPRGVAVDRLGMITLADSGNNILRRIAAQQTPLVPLTVTVANAIRPYGSPNPSFTGTISGILPADSIGNTIIVSYSTAATERSSSGRYAITATISGPSATKYSVTVQTGTLEITPAATATTLTAIATSGTAVTFSATVTSTVGTPVGTVAFYDGGATLLGTSNLDWSGAATLSVSTLAPGTHSIAAVFRETNNYTTSAGTLTQTIAAPGGSFTLAASQALPAARSTGQSVYQLTLNSIGIFSGTIALSCSGLPAGGSCAFSSTPTLTPGGTATVTMTVTTPITHAALIAPANTPATNLTPLIAAAIFPLELPAIGAILSSFRRRRSVAALLRLFVLTALIPTLTGLTGCGASGGTTSAPATTQASNYTVQVTGTSLTFAAPSQIVTITVPAQ